MSMTLVFCRSPRFLVLMISVDPANAMPSIFTSLHSLFFGCPLRNGNADKHMVDASIGIPVQWDG
jgi:hypothetical protein